MRSQRYCPDCGPLAAPHYKKWIEDLLALMPRVRIGFPALSGVIARAVDAFFVYSGIVREEYEIDSQILPARTRYFWEEATSRGLCLSVLTYRGRPINHYFFRVRPSGRKYYFEGYPRAEHLNNTWAERIDDKYWVKKQLEKAGFPVAPGKAFWWWQVTKALRYAQTLSTPVVVKPFFGSMSQHVYLDLRSEGALRDAISHVSRYTPYFIIERFVPSRSVYRYNVIDQESVFVAKRTPPYVIGDGVSSVVELVGSKNRDPGRAHAGDQRSSRYALLVDDRARTVLKAQGYTLQDVPEYGAVVYIQDKVLLDLGAEIEEVTPDVHPDNLELARAISRHFGVFVVGIDVIMQDVSRSWREQETAVLELNSLPYLDIHHNPEIGRPQDTAGALCDMVARRYR